MQVQKPSGAEAVVHKYAEVTSITHFQLNCFKNTTMSRANKGITFFPGQNSTCDGAVMFSTLLLLPKTGGDLGSNLTLKEGGCPIRSGYYLSASSKCGIKSQRAKEFEGTQWLVRRLWKAKPIGLFSVTMQPTDDKTQMASADSSCSSAPLFHGPQTGCTGGGMRH